MRKLTKAGLITSTLGTNAAISLAKKADQITLLDVYRATMEDNQEIFMIHRDTNPTCPVGSKMPYLLDGVYTKVQTTMENELSGITIDSMVKSGIIGIES